ncbi:MAG: hypothetical protein QM784_37485 [Polyangiaceae bacterium]
MGKTRKRSRGHSPIFNVQSSTGYTALVFEEAQVGHYVERWAPIPNGIVVQERLLAAPGEALRSLDDR